MSEPGPLGDRPDGARDTGRGEDPAANLEAAGQAGDPQPAGGDPDAVAPSGDTGTAVSSGEAGVVTPGEPAPNDVVDPPDGEPAVEPVAPAEPPRRRRPRWAVALIAVGAVLVLLAAGSVVAVRVLAHRYESALHQADLLDPDARSSSSAEGGLPGLPTGTIDGPLNFLILGSDLRDNDPDGGQRSDTIILVHVPASHDRAYLISIPRDLRVRIPPDPATGFEGSRQKINAAFNFGGGGTGGFKLLSRVLKNLIGITFDGAAIINFDGFKSAVHLLGGVDMCIDHRTVSIHTGAVFEVGCQHLTAAQALDYVRQRKTLPNGDYDRQRHQQQFLKAVFQEAIDQGIVTNPLKLDMFLRRVGDALTVDTNGTSLVSLVLTLHGIRPSSVVGIRLPSHPAMIGGVSFVLPDDGAESLYHAIAEDTLDAWTAEHTTWVNPT